MKRRSIILASLVSLLLMQARISGAQVTPERLREAERRFSEGKELLKSHDYEGARLKFLQACAVSYTVNCPKNLAVAEYHLGQFARATTHFEEYLDKAPKNDPVRAEVQKFHDDAFAKSGHVHVVAPDGASVQIDGDDLGRAPLPPIVHVATGHHELRATLGDGTIETASTDVAEGQTTEVSLDRKSVPPVPAPASTTQAAATPATPLQASPLRAPLDRGQSTPAAPFWTTRHVVGAGVAALGAVSLTAATILAVQAQSAASDATTLRGNNTNCGSNCGALEDAYNKQSTDTTLNLVFLGVGLAALAAGTAVFFWPTTSSDTRAALVPMVTPTGGELRLRWEM